MVRRGLLTVAGGALALTLAACGSADSGTAAPASPAPPSSSAGANRGPAASGTVAQVSGSSIEMQNQTDGQVTVNFSGSTTFTDRVAATLADVTAGSCVVVTGTGTPVTAKTVEISAPVDGACDGGFRGAGGGMRPQNGTARPSRTNSQGNGQGRGAFGKVTAVSGTGFTVEQDNRQTGATTSVQVTVDAGTTYTKSEAANSSALKVGECVAATGKADETGAVTAQTISISQAGPNGCTTGFGGRRETGGGNG
ncbi:hypothetical protein [Amycolatopsis sacchari]|uniref:hypothetical protein n=1 Tax=Amycolatopsis sacchari TaxID=115433 RepID=UPI003D75DF53